MAYFRQPWQGRPAGHENRAHHAGISNNQRWGLFER